MNQQRLLDWLNKEKTKDDVEIEKYKKDLVSKFQKLKKEDLFKKEKPTLWKRLKKMQSHFREIDRHHKQFTVEISGVDFHFMLEEKETEITDEDKS